MSSPASPRPPTRKQLLIYAANLRRALPELAGLGDETLVETMLGPDRRGRGRPRNCAEKDDQRLYAIAFTECLGVEPNDGLKEMLGSTTHPEHGKLLRYYERHRSDYRKGALALRWDEGTELLSVTPAGADELSSLPKLTFDADELLKNSRISDERWAALQAFARK